NVAPSFSKHDADTPHPSAFGAHLLPQGEKDYGRPIRLISQFNCTPVFASTSARTASPNPSMSAAVASPGLIMKLECSSLNLAPPPVTACSLPRQPASSTSFHEEWPSGFLKVEPPVFSRIGWVFSRRSVISLMRAATASGASGAPR